jgi:hypothetical protein
LKPKAVPARPRGLFTALFLFPSPASDFKTDV